VPSERFSIAQVSPYAWEQHHEVNAYVERVSDELCKRGHRVVVIAPSDSRELIRDGRQTVKRLSRDPDAVFASEGCAQVIAVGQSLPFPPTRKGAAVSLPLDVSRTIEDLLTLAQFDFVHVHEPFAPSASSAALRHSRALNVGTFHAPAERVMSTQLVRKLVELLFGRRSRRARTWWSGGRPMARWRSCSAWRRSGPRCACSCARCAGFRATCRGARPSGRGYRRLSRLCRCRGRCASG
jgi:hypothetical protein